MSKRVCTSLLPAPLRSRFHQPTCLLVRHHQNQQPPSTASSNRRATRPFSSSVRRCAENPSGRGKAQKSSKRQQKEAMERMAASGEILDYVGVKDIFVPPTGRNLPSLFSNWRGRRTILYYQYRSWVQVLQSRFLAFWLVKPRLKLQRAQTPAIAQTLYKDMYTALAGGEVELGKIEGRINPLLKFSLRARIAQRAPNTFMQWKLHRYMAPRECVYFNFGLFDMEGPSTKRTGIMQAVVRIKSQQSLLTFQRRRIKDPANPRGPMVEAEVPVDRDGEVIVDFDQEAEERQSLKTVEEYFVIERTLINGVLGQWRAWGTIQETTLEKIRKMEKEKEKALHGGGPSSA